MGGGISTVNELVIEEMRKPLDVSDITPRSERYQEEIARLRATIRELGEAAGISVEEGGEGGEGVDPEAAAAEAAAVEGMGLMDVARYSFFRQYYSVEEAFTSADTSGSGCLSFDEFIACIQAGGLDLNGDDAVFLAQQADLNQDGMIDYKEFMKFLDLAETDPSAEVQERSNEVAVNLREQCTERFRSMRRAFLSIDTDRTGYIDASEVNTLLTNENFGYSEEEVTMFIAGFPHENEGGFSYVEFCTMIEGAAPFSKFGDAE
jgi:Ca2+-binding EF-hand superfamily protein